MASRTQPGAAQWGQTFAVRPPSCLSHPGPGNRGTAGGSPRQEPHLVIALCYHSAGPFPEKRPASETKRPDGTEMSIYQEILDHNFKHLMTQSKHSLTPGPAGCTAVWSQVVCVPHPRDPSTAQMLRSLPSGHSEGHYFCNCFLPTENFSIPWLHHFCRVAGLVLSSRFPVKTSHKMPDNQGLAPASAGFWVCSKSLPLAPFSSQTVLISNQRASPGSLCSANSSTKPPAPPAPITCSLRGTGSQPDVSCAAVSGLRIRVNGACEHPGAESGLRVLCPSLLLGCWQRRQPAHGDPSLPLPGQPGSGSCPVLVVGAGREQKAAALAGGRQRQPKSR